MIIEAIGSYQHQLYAPVLFLPNYCHEETIIRPAQGRY